MLLEGLFVPITTPFLPNGRLNLPKLRENVVRYAKTPAAGLVALSRLGQPELLSEVETEEVLRCVADATVAEKVLIAGICRDSVLHTLDLIEAAAKMGYDVAVVRQPAGSAGSSRMALSYFEAVADLSVLPLLLDSGTGDHLIATNTLHRAANHRNVLGVLDAAAGAARVSAIRDLTSGVRRQVNVTTVFAAATSRMMMKHSANIPALVSPDALSAGGAAVALSPPSPVSALKIRTKVVGFQILCARTSGILEALGAGACGAAPPLAASAPQACYEVVAAWKDGDLALAEEKQERVQLAARVVEEQMGLAGIKYGCDLNGYFGGRPRLPWLPLSGSEREEVETAMSGLRN